MKRKNLRKIEIRNRISKINKALNTDGRVLFSKIVELSEKNTEIEAMLGNWILAPNTLYTRELCSLIKYEDELLHFNATCNIDDTIHRQCVWGSKANG